MPWNCIAYIASDILPKAVGVNKCGLHAASHFKYCSLGAGHTGITALAMLCSRDKTYLEWRREPCLQC